MDRDCERTQELLVEVAGDPACLQDEVARHLLDCARCREVADREARLGELIGRSLAPTSDELIGRMIAGAEFHRRRRRVVAFAPVALSASVAVVGAALVGGIPGIGLVGALPGWSSQGWLALLGAVRDSATVVGALARNVPVLVPPLVLLGSAGLALGGGALAVVASRRWARAVEWSRRG